MSSERRISRVRKVIEVLGDSRADWQIISEMAKRMGFEDQFNYHSPDEVWEEIRKLWTVGAGISYPRIIQNGLQWPCPDENHPGTQNLHADSFPVGKKASLQLIPYRPTKEQTTAEYPFLLTTGRVLSQFNAGTMTLRTNNVLIYNKDILLIHPDDASRLKINSGDSVKINSSYGEAKMNIEISSKVKPGELFSTFTNSDVFINQVTSDVRDSYTMTPEYKVTAVQINKIY